MRRRVLASGFAGVVMVLMGVHVASAAPVSADPWPCVYVLRDDPYIWIEVCPPLFMFANGPLVSYSV